MSLVESSLAAWVGSGFSPRTNTVTSASFTPAANSLIVVVTGSGNAAGATQTGITVSDSVSGSWTPLIHKAVPNSGDASVWVKDAGPSPSAQTVTVTMAPSTVVDVGLAVRQFTGAAPAAQQNGVVNSNSASASIAITPGTTGSQVVGAFASAGTSNVTANGSTTLYGQTPDSSGGGNEGGFEASALSTGGTQLTLGYTSAQGGDVLAVVEILPASNTAAAASWPSFPTKSRLQHHHGVRRTQQQAVFPTVLNVTAGVASATGAAGGQNTSSAFPPNAVPGLAVPGATVPGQPVTPVSLAEVDAQAGVASAAGTAYAATPGRVPGTAAATGTAYSPVPEIDAADQTGALGTGQALDASVVVVNGSGFNGVATWPSFPAKSRLQHHHGVRRTQQQAVFSAIQQNASPTAGLAAAAGTAYGQDNAAPLAEIDVKPAVAAATGTARAPAPGWTPAVASATGTAYGPVPEVDTQPTLAAGTGTTPQVVPEVDVPAALAPATGAAYGSPPVVFNPTSFQQVVHRDWHRAYRRRQLQMVPLGAVPNIYSPPLVTSGFGTFPQVPANAVIVSVIANVTWYGSDALIGAPAYELWDGTAAIIGTRQYGTASVTPGYVDSIVFTGVRYAQLTTLQLQIFASTQPGNTGATASFDAVSLSVEWMPNRDAAVTPGVLAVTSAVPRPGLSVGVLVKPGVLAKVPAFPAPSAGLLNASIFPAVLAVVPVVQPPKARAGSLVQPGTLAVVPAFPAITDVTAPGWATAEVDGGWTNPGNITGTPDGSYATWTAP